MLGPRTPGLTDGPGLSSSRLTSLVTQARAEDRVNAAASAPAAPKTADGGFTAPLPAETVMPMPQLDHSEPTLSGAEAVAPAEHAPEITPEPKAQAELPPEEKEAASKAAEALSRLEAYWAEV